ncbi:acyl-CoA reductase-like NAD-dependent aldehyde dehydrogenase [Streptomyces sp. AK010]|nr:acyl-CoA reductase-like NAD-dependent aldehyde dehydrogenase [Streptomyces sp. AK010]
MAAVIAWNSPFSSATAKIIPALLAGNSVVLMVSPENSLGMGFLAELLEKAGLPEGVISVLPADRETSEYLVSHREVDKIAFTGPTEPAVASPRSRGSNSSASAWNWAERPHSMRIAQEEIFGPVLVVIAYDDEDQAVRIANVSEYGLSGGVWSADAAHALAVARRVRTGTVTVNGAPVALDGPFGGFKASGIGRERGAVGLGTLHRVQDHHRLMR